MKVWKVAVAALAVGLGACEADEGVGDSCGPEAVVVGSVQEGVFESDECGSGLCAFHQGRYRCRVGEDGNVCDELPEPALYCTKTCIPGGDDDCPPGYECRREFVGSGAHCRDRSFYWSEDSDAGANDAGANDAGMD